MFYPKIGDYVLLRNGKVVRITAEDLPSGTYGISVPNSKVLKFSCSGQFIGKVLPPVNLDNLKLGDKVRLASGRIWKINGMDCPTDRSWFLVRFSPQDAGVNYCRYNRQGGNITISASDQSFNIVEIIPQVDLYTLKAGDTVKLASSETREVKSVAYRLSERKVEVLSTTCKSSFPWIYQRDGALHAYPENEIAKIIPKLKLDFSMNTVDLTTLKEGDTVHLSDCSTTEVVSIARKMLGTIYVIHLRTFGLNHYCVDGYSLDKDKPSIVRIVDTSAAKERGAEILRQSRGRALRDRVAMPGVEIFFGVDPAVTRESLYDFLRKSTLFAGSTPLGISQFVNSLFDVDLTTLQPGDTVKLANSKTEKVERIAYGSPENPFRIYFADDTIGWGWFYSASGNCAGVEVRKIVKIIPKPRSSATVALKQSPDGRFITPRITVRGTGATAATVRSKPKLNLYTLEPGAVVTLANGNTKEVLEVDLQSRAHENHVYITFADGVWIYNPDGTRPPGRDRTCNIVSVTTAAILADIKAHKEFAESVDVTTIKRGDKLTLANGKEVIAGKVTARPVAGETYTVWRENGCPIVDVHVNGTALRAGSHAWSIVKITPRPKPTPLTINGHIVKSGDRLRLRNGTVNTVRDVTWNEHDDNWKVAYGGEFAGSLRNFFCYSSGKNPFNSEFDITAVVNEPTPLTIGGHVVKPGDVLTRADGDRIVVDKITPEPCGNWKVWHSAYGGCFFEVDSSGRCHLSPDLTITAVAHNRTAPPCRWPANPFWYLSSSQSPRQVPWPKPITTPPTKKDADPIRQVAVLDKDGDWMQEEWWAARDRLAEGKIAGWAHTQAWHDASDPWN